MFCPSCGTENSESFKYCKNCGTKLNIETKKHKYNILIIFTSFILIFLVSLYFILSSKCNPINVAKNYFLDIKSGNAEKIYKYYDVEDNGLTSRKIFKKVSSLSQTDLLNYSVISSEMSSDGLSYKVVISYTIRGENTSKDVMEINLVKNKNKKYLFFDNWIVSNESNLLTKDYRINAPKDSTIKIENVEIDKKYIDKDYSSYFDSYVLPKIFKGTYDVNLILKNGLPLSGKMNVKNYTIFKLDELNISNEELIKIDKKVPKLIELLYQSAIEKKSFNDIKSNFQYADANLNDLEKAYNSFMNTASSCGLVKFNLKSSKVNKTKISGSYVTAVIKIDYEYTASKVLLGEEKSKTGADSSTIYFDFDYVDGDYKLVDISSMPRFFSVF